MMSSLQNRVSIAALALLLLTGGAARAEEGREADFTRFLAPAYPLFLAKAGLWKADPAEMQALAAQAAKGLAAVAPAGCDGAGFQKDFCGMAMRTVPASSMAPTIAEKEIIMARPYGDAAPQRGDVVVFSAKSATSQTPLLYVKRLIGLPGDKVELRGGAVFLNDKVLETVPTGRTMTDIMGKTAKIFEETMPDGRRHTIAMTDDAVAGQDDAGPFVVPEGRYFMLGDNRHNSLDSRFPDQFGEGGFVVAGEVSGRAVTIFVSSDAGRIGTVIE